VVTKLQISAGACLTVLVVVLGARTFGSDTKPLQTHRLDATSCAYPQSVQTVTFSKSKYPSVWQHYEDATAKGWPVILVLDRHGDDARRTRLLRNIRTAAGQDRDEYPPAVAREGWLADVELIPSTENRSQGGSLGVQLHDFCDGVRFRYDWTP
jgi:hypothetical protein